MVLNLHIKCTRCLLIAIHRATLRYLKYTTKTHMIIVIKSLLTKKTKKWNTSNQFILITVQVNLTIKLKYVNLNLNNSP